MSRAKEEVDDTYKLLLIGDSGVGKTALMLRWISGDFDPTFIATIGIDFKHKIKEIQGRKLKIEVWDTAGQERFRAITSSFLRGAHGILLCYDTSERSSFNNVDDWMFQIDQYADIGVEKILVATKCDLDGDRRAVSKEEGETLAESHEISYVETSSKTGMNIDDAFVKLAEQIMETREKENPTSKSTTTATSGSKGQGQGQVKGMSLTSADAEDGDQQQQSSCCG